MSRCLGVPDISGKRFGKLTAKTLTKIGNRSAWECVCECGTVRIVRNNNLLSGNTTSCGCSRIGKLKPPRRPRSEYIDMPEYRVWKGIKQRCLNPSNPRFVFYGGRGITICKRWSDSFADFIGDMGRRPSDKHQLDRINNNAGYAPENCRWTDAKSNARNRRDNLTLAHDGKALTLSEWAEVTGIHWGTIWARIRKNGWSVSRALTEPVHKEKRNKRAI